MLNLAAPTDSGWFDRIAPHLDTILIDHTHLEKRAASTALNMIFKYSPRPALAATLSPVVREEMEHFEQMLAFLDTRGISFCKQKPAPYAGKLVSHVRSHEPQALLDKLLVAALIEARSCERFKILADRVDVPVLADYYAELFESEARHHTTYTDLARHYFGQQTTHARLQQMASAELAALQASEGQARLHSW